MKRYPSILLCCLLAVMCGCGPTPAVEETRTLFLMDTYMELRCFGENAQAALDACAEEAARLDALFSATNAASDVSRMNEAAGTLVAVDETTLELLSRAKQLSVITGGAFDPALRTLITAWGFTEPKQSVPSSDVLDALLPVPGESAIRIEGSFAAVDPPAGVDLGGIAKGYCGERLHALLCSYGIESALLSLGGNIEAIGTRQDGTPWRVGIQDPSDASAIIGVLELTDCAAVTSGGYQRYFEEDGVRYHHILDPKTGYPADSGLLSVTVFSKSGTEADALSTAFFILGLDCSLALIRSGAVDCEAVFVLSDHSVFCTNNAIFTSANN